MLVSHPLSAMFFIAAEEAVLPAARALPGSGPALHWIGAQAGRSKRTMCNQPAKYNSPSTGRSGCVAGTVFRLAIDRRQPGPETACLAAATEDAAATAVEAVSPDASGTNVTPPTFRRITPYRRWDSSHRTGSASLPPPHPRHTAAPRPLAASLPWPLCACGRPS